MDMETMDDHIGNKLDGDASPISDVDIHSTGINCLETVHYQFLLQFDHHVSLEHDPQRPVLDDGVTESARSGIDGVVIIWVCHHIVPSITPTNGIASEANATVSKALAVKVPMWVTAPAVINGIPRSTREITQVSPFRTIADGPERNFILKAHLLLKYSCPTPKNQFNFQLELLRREKTC